MVHSVSMVLDVHPAILVVKIWESGGKPSTTVRRPLNKRIRPSFDTHRGYNRLRMQRSGFLSFQLAVKHYGDSMDESEMNQSKIGGRIVKQTFVVICTDIAACRSARAGEHPNIALLMGDDHGWDEVGYSGRRHLKTPALDEMATHGIAIMALSRKPRLVTNTT